MCWMLSLSVCRAIVATVRSKKTLPLQQNCSTMALGGSRTEVSAAVHMHTCK